MNHGITLVWFRQDLRLWDNPALFAASERGSVLPLYVLDEGCLLGEASGWWLHHSLNQLNRDLNDSLRVVKGNPESVILDLLTKYPIDAVYWNRCYDPWRIAQDGRIKAHLKNLHIDCRSFQASLLWEPWSVLKSDETPYKMYTPFYRKVSFDMAPPRHPLPLPTHLKIIPITHSHTMQDIHGLGLHPSIPWYTSMEPLWDIGERAAQKKLQSFLKHELLGYKEKRNFPGEHQVSHLSPHLHFGEISPYQIWYEMQLKTYSKKVPLKDIEYFLRELVWREFSYYLLYHFPTLPEENFQKKFNSFPWKETPSHLKAWQEGKTGYPLVDAGMRELWKTGYMHNRVRMVVASFLTKNLFIHWKEGAKWFLDCLLDADLANNSMNWQWVAGSGVDAAPYFRIFNPIHQGEKFDEMGTYTRQFVPELSQLPKKWLFKPWKAPEEVLTAAGVILGDTYPYPIVDLKTSREEALLAYKQILRNS